MRILIATGGAPHSNIAVQLAAQLARGAQQAPTLLTVIKHESEYTLGQAILDQALDIMGMKKNGVKTVIRMGNPAKEILSESDEGHYDLIVVGSRPTHKLVTRLLGSTAEWVVSHAPCPVLIAKGAVTPLQHILICVSGAASPSPQTVFFSRLVPMLHIAQITMLHVMSQISADPAAEEEWQLFASAAEMMQENEPEGKLLTQDLEALAHIEGIVLPRLRHGPVVNEILAEAHDGDYDLIVIGAHQARGWQRFLLDNLAHQIVVQSDRPVLVV